MIPVLVQDCLHFWRRNSPHQTAFIFEDVVLTYEEFCRWTDGVAAALSHRGVRVGDVVCVTGDNSLKWIVAALGIIKAGAILAGMNQRSVSAEFSYLIDRSGAHVVLADATRRDVLRKAQTTSPFEILPLEELDVYRNGAAWEHPQRSPNDPFAIVFTSGSTGRPKAVIQTHLTYLSTAIERQFIEPVYGFGMRQLSVIPLFGNGGSVWGYLNTLMRGGTFVLEPRFDAARTLAQIERHQIQVFGGVPYFFEQMAAEPSFSTTRLDSLKSVITGGARVSPELLQKWRGKGVQLRQIYGMTELGIVATVSTDEEVSSGAETCGRGGIFTRLRIARPDGSHCAPGEAGEIRAKGPSCTVGYWRDPEGTANLFDADGWLRTGDIGTMDKTGLLKFIDRAKDIIISGGFNISPSEIENVILQIHGVAEVAVIAARDAKFDETPLAIVYSSAGIDPKAIVGICNENLSDYKVPRYVDVVDAPLPRMSTGKIDKQVLAARYADAHARLPRVR